MFSPFQHLPNGERRRNQQRQSTDLVHPDPCLPDNKRRRANPNHLPPHVIASASAMPQKRRLQRSEKSRPPATWIVLSMTLASSSTIPSSSKQWTLWQRNFPVCYRDFRILSCLRRKRSMTPLDSNLATTDALPKFTIIPDRTIGSFRASCLMSLDSPRRSGCVRFLTNFDSSVKSYRQAQPVRYCILPCGFSACDQACWTNPDWINPMWRFCHCLDGGLCAR